MLKTLSLLSILSFTFSATALANSITEPDSFTVSSDDMHNGKFLNKSQEFNGFGCTGDDTSPQLKWTGAPEGTKSFAITAFDPDAPTGSGWWHWQIINIKASVNEIKNGAGSNKKTLAPTGSQQMINDYGSQGFGGACPPAGHGVHHYRFTVHALSIETLNLPKDASGALTGYMINSNTIGTATLEALYKRD